MLAKAIIVRMKTGSIQNVVLFSYSMKVPPPPYAIVKPETGSLQNTRQYRIIVHHNAGHFDALQDYVLRELDRLLSGWLEDGEGGRYKLYPNGYTDITAEPEGETFFMERLYYTPLAIR